MLASFYLLMCFELLLFFFHLPLLLDERILIGDVNTSEPVSALSARTRRVDPLNSFKKYKGGYNITSTHYWSFFAFFGVAALRQPRLYKIFYLKISRFSGDSCVALAEYTLHPRNSNLSSIMPCSEQLSANAMLRDIRAGIHNTIDQVPKFKDPRQNIGSDIMKFL
ncbi:hypothetical protein BHM03_00001470 [Ensete ventricosum]|nr:hypothetical protein BHM03_00001470 [Ensete ventricosum]